MCKFFNVARKIGQKRNVIVLNRNKYSNIEGFAMLPYKTIHRWIWKINTGKVFCNNVLSEWGRNTINVKTILLKENIPRILLISKNVLQ